MDGAQISSANSRWSPKSSAHEACIEANPYITDRQEGHLNKLKCLRIIGYVYESDYLCPKTHFKIHHTVLERVGQIQMISFPREPMILKPNVVCRKAK